MSEPTSAAPRMAGAPSTSGYALLAAEVVAQALRDAPRKAHRGDVLVAVRSGTLAWWMAQAGVHERAIAPALEVIAALACPLSPVPRPLGGRPPSLWARRH